LVVIDAENWTVRQEVQVSVRGQSMHGIALTRDGQHLYATGAPSSIWQASITANGLLEKWERGIVIPGNDEKKDAKPTAKKRGCIPMPGHWSRMRRWP